MNKATSLFVALAVVLAASACRSGTSNADQTGTNPQPPISPTIPPGYSDTLPPGTLIPSPSPASAGGAASTTESLLATPQTSVLAENQAFCEALQQREGLFSAAGPGVDDATALREIKETFTTLTSLAPTGIKPEIEGMNNTIQSLSSASDIDKLDDPNFTALQERFAAFVLTNCGFEIAS